MGIARLVTLTKTSEYRVEWCDKRMKSETFTDFDKAMIFVDNHNRDYEPRPCKICGKPFMPRRIDQETCSKKCSPKNQQNKRAKTGRKEIIASKNKGNDTFSFTGCKLLVDLKEHNHLCNKEIAEVLGKSEKSVNEKEAELKASGNYDKLWNLIQAERYTSRWV